MLMTTILLLPLYLCKFVTASARRILNQTDCWSGIVYLGTNRNTAEMLCKHSCIYTLSLIVSDVHACIGLMKCSRLHVLVTFMFKSHAVPVPRHCERVYISA